MIPALTNHLWQSTLFVIAAALVAAALRRNGAHVRHWVWLIASLKFLLPLSVLMSIGSLLPPIAPEMPVTDATTVSDLSITVDRIAQPFTSNEFTETVTTSQAEASWIAPAIVGVWACGFLAVVLMRLRGWRRVRAALRASTPLPLTAPVPARSSPGLLEPGVVGLWRPVLLVPAGIEQQLTPRQLQIVLLHELCHVRRRDNLTSAIHMVVEAIFWFHPLVWFVGARLVDERERACDEYVLQTSGDPAAYAESILSVCKLYVESPLACVSGVGGSDLRKRVAAILVNRVGLPLSLARKVTLAIAAALAIGLPLVAGMLLASTSAAAQGGSDSSFAQAAADKPADKQTYPKFDVVSVKPCERDAPGQARGQTGRGGGTPITSPGRLYLQCYPLASLIREAYLFFADGRAHGLSSLITVGTEGGPDWMQSERFLIEAKTDLVVPAAVMRGPMLKAVLEDRFKLKIRRVTREMPVYELVIAKSGAKVAPYTGNDCVIKDEAVWPPAALPEGQRYCGDRSRVAGDVFIREGVMTLGELVSLFNFDRPVVNKTGITAPVSYRVEFAREDSGGFGGGGEAPRASWMSALRNQLGLDLREGKGPRDFLVIDSVERPTPDPPSPGSWPSLAEGPQAQPSSARFEVVSVKPCPKDPPPAGPAAPAGFRRGGAPWHPTVSPGYAFWSCATLAQLVDQAYADQDHPLLNIIANPRQDLLNQPKRVRGGPSWVETERFTIEAKAPVEITTAGVAGNTGRVMTTLPTGMSQALRAVLEDRFKVQVHRATEQQNMFALTIAKGGLNKQLVTDPVKGDCLNPAEYSAAVAAGNVSPVDADLRICGRYHVSVDKGMRFYSFSFRELAKALSGMFDHYVLDKTGVETPFNFTIKTDPVDGASREVLFSRAIEQLGLKLEPTKGPAEYLVIDRAERPTPDSPIGAQ